MLCRFLNDNGQLFRHAAEAAAIMRSTSPRVSAVVDAHINSISGIESGTRARYRRILANHITPLIGGLPVERLTRAHVLDWFEKLDVAPKTKKNIHALLSAALQGGRGRGARGGERRAGDTDTQDQPEDQRGRIPV